MIKSIKDNVLNEESQALVKAIASGKDYAGKELEFYGNVEIHENPNSGWIYAADEDGNCYLFSDSDNTKLEKHVYCVNCGYENFKSEFINEATDDCCFQYAKEAELPGWEDLEEEEEEEEEEIMTSEQIKNHLTVAWES